MPSPRRNSTRANPDQLDFALPREELSGALHSQGLFSSNYLQRHFAHAADFPPVAEIETLYREARALWEEKLPGLRKQKEAYTRTAFLDPLLKLLGWHFIPEANLPHGPTRKRPDYALFPAAARCENAAAASDATDIFRLSETVLEANRWQHPLDEASSSETPGWFPSEQIQDYLRHARDATGARFFNWATSPMARAGGSTASRPRAMRSSSSPSRMAKRSVRPKTSAFSSHSSAPPRSRARTRAACSTTSASRRSPARSRWKRTSRIASSTCSKTSPPASARTRQMLLAKFIRQNFSIG